MEEGSIRASHTLGRVAMFQSDVNGSRLEDAKVWRPAALVVLPADTTMRGEGAPLLPLYDNRRSPEPPSSSGEPCCHTGDEGNPHGKMASRGGLLEQGEADCTRIFD